MSCGLNLRSIIGNIKKLFPPKTGMRKMFCKIQGMLEVSKVHAASYLARLYGYSTNCPMSYKEISNFGAVKRNKKYSNQYIRLHLSLFVM